MSLDGVNQHRLEAYAIFPKKMKTKHRLTLSDVNANMGAVQLLLPPWKSMHAHDSCRFDFVQFYTPAPLCLILVQLLP